MIATSRATEKITLTDKITVYVEYYETVRFDKIVDDILIGEISRFWSVDGAINRILDTRTEGTFFIYVCKNGIFADKDVLSFT